MSGIISLERTAEILLVEDNPADVRLTQEALKAGGIRNHLHVTIDGEAALDFLYQRGPYQESPRPDMVLLDLNLPGRNGLEILKIIKADAGLRRIPVVMLTTSANETDIYKSYDLHANCFITKPVELPDFIRTISSLKQFWLQVAAISDY